MDKFRLLSTVCNGLLFLLSSTVTLANVIDFETVPGSAPQDRLPITDQYQVSHGVTFYLVEPDGTPHLEKTGAFFESGYAFINQELNSYDIESPGYEGGMGNYFLRFGINNLTRFPGPTLIIDYATPVSAASGQIWDIDAAPGNVDGFESWTIMARDGGGNVIETINSPNGVEYTELDSLDGKPWIWSFNRTSSDIHSIAIRFTGTANLVGLAFDNFSPASADSDFDGIPDGADNCPGHSNTNQVDSDGDGIGDVCDPQTCGDDILQEPEQCDDGNRVSGDGCSSDCGNECSAVTGSTYVDSTCCVVNACYPDEGLYNHGLYVACVTHAAKEHGLKGSMKGAVVSAASRSTVNMPGYCSMSE